MRKKSGKTLTLALLAALALAACTTVSRAERDETPGSLQFEGKNLLTTAHGVFHRWYLRRVELDRDHPERSVIEVEVDIESLDTGIGRRDDHLRSEDFFDVAKFPTAVVRVYDATPDGESDAGNPRYRAKFAIRIRDVEKTLEGHFEVVSMSPLEVGGEVLLNRVEFGVGAPHSWWNPLSIKDEIPVRFSTRIPIDGAREEAGPRPRLSRPRAGHSPAPHHSDGPDVVCKKRS